MNRFASDRAIEKKAQKDRATAEKMARTNIPILNDRDDEAPPLKIAICLPTHDMVPAGFMYDLANLTGFTGMSLMADGIADIALNMMSGTIIQASREDLAQRAVEISTTHMLWLDTDMKFPKDSLIRLLNRNKPIVGINYSVRKVPAEFVAYESLEPDPDTLIRPRLRTIPGETTGLQKAAAIGFGLVLVQTPVLYDMPKPWFDFKWVGPGADWKGEDVHFCEQATEAGYDIWVDADLSARCAHIGQFQYRLEHAVDLMDDLAADREKQRGTSELLGSPDGDSNELDESD